VDASGPGDVLSAPAVLRGRIAGFDNRGCAVPGFEELQVPAPLGAALESLGWPAADPIVREAIPTALRGHPVVLLTPPTARWMAPALGAAFTRLTPGGGLQAVILAPATLQSEIGSVAGRLAAPLGLRVLAASGLGRASARLQEAGPDILVAAPDIALALLGRSALHTDGVVLAVVAWPELAESDAALEAVLPELPRDAQRLGFSSRAAGVADLVARWARKAITIGLPPAEAPPAPIGPVRVAVVPRARRLAALDAVLDVLDPDSLAVWVADQSEAARVRDHLAGRELPVSVGVDLEDAACVVAYDLPARADLSRLLELGREVVILAPASAGQWLASIAQPRRPLRLPDAADGAADAAAGARAAVAARLESGTAGPGLLAVAPLLERWDAAAVAGALWDLWRAASRTPAEAEPDRAGPGSVPEVARIWAGAGKRDGATPADFVAALAKEVGLDRTKIGRIELRESFALIEVPAAEAEQIARALDGLTIRRRRIAARVDRGTSRPGGATGPRGRVGRPPRPDA
jgi:ATP-dependent RNA helicase DeaD